MAYTSGTELGLFKIKSMTFYTSAKAIKSAFSQLTPSKPFLALMSPIKQCSPIMEKTYKLKAIQLQSKLPERQKTSFPVPSLHMHRHNRDGRALEMVQVRALH